jgi:hypothetical protein
MIKAVYIAAAFNGAMEQLFYADHERDNYDEAAQDGEELVKNIDEVVYFKVEKFFKD